MRTLQAGPLGFIGSLRTSGQVGTALAFGFGLGAMALVAGCSGTRSTGMQAETEGSRAQLRQSAAQGDTSVSSRSNGSLAAPPPAMPAGRPGEWTMQGKNYAQTRYSALDQITTANVAQLRQAWTFSTGVLNGHEGAPLVIDSVMYLVTPYPDIAYALDLTKPGSIKWSFHPNPDPWSIGVA
ncbi:MAG TPA: hypothetical protein VN677_01080, partial [Gemmatimonadaceae bacterium]|nr:hypothetical protein [Gemmatimonadaceae bacterium]